MHSLDSLPIPLFGSQGASNAIRALCSKGKRSSKSYFPKVHGWSNEHARVKTNGTNSEHTSDIQNWFRMVIGDEENAHTRIDDCALDVEQTIACFATMAWEKSEITFCRMQILITEGGSLMDFYNDYLGCARAIYYRLELDPKQPGPMFTEPQPHIHTVPKGAPRLPFFCGEREFLPLAFLEFIYLNHKTDKWTKWAQQVSGFKKPDLDTKALIEAFTHGEGKLWKARSTFGPQLRELKCILAAAKRDHARDEPAPSTQLDFMNYWQAT
jgi:hypothetical protein